MKKTFLKILSFFLVVIMAFTVVPTCCAAKSCAKIVKKISFAGQTNTSFEISSASITLNQNIQINFKVPQGILDVGYTDPYLQARFNGYNYTITDYTVSDGYLVFSFEDINPSQFNDNISAQVFATLNGSLKQTQSVTYSVAKYCYDMLKKTNLPELGTLLVNLLNYGSAAQIYNNYKTSSLANSALTPTQKALASQKRSYTSVLDTDYVTVYPQAVNFRGATLSLTGYVDIKFIFEATDISGLTMEIGGNDYLAVLDDSEFVHYDGNLYYVSFSGVNAVNMSKDIFAAIYKNGEQVSNTARYSVESYVAEMQSDKSATPELLELLDEMIKYGDSARIFFEGYDDNDIYGYSENQQHMPILDSERYHYSTLNEHDRRIYNIIDDAISNFRMYADINEELQVSGKYNIYYMYMADHPEMFYLGNEVYVYSYGSEDTEGLAFVYAYGIEDGETYGPVVGDMPKQFKGKLLEKVDTFENSVKSFVSTIPVDAPDIIKEKLIYQKILLDCCYNSYAEPYSEANPGKDWNAYGILVDHTGVCESYVEAFQTLLNRVGIVATGIEGVVTNSVGTFAHKWCAVKLDGEWYSCDPTFDDPTGGGDGISRFNYFNLTTIDMQNTGHSEYTNYLSYPQCTGTKYGYTNYFG